MTSKDPANMVSMKFTVYGDLKHDVHVVSISRGAKIWELIQAIDDVYSNCPNGDHIGVASIFKLDASPNTLNSIGYYRDTRSLLHNCEISKYWPGELDDETVHILVKPIFLKARPSSRPSNLKSPSRFDTDIEDNYRQLSLKQRRFLYAINNEPDPFNGPGCDQRGLPLELYHPAFRSFTTYVHSNTTPNATDLSAMEFLLFFSQDAYSDKEDRKTAVRDVLNSLLDKCLSVDQIGGCIADGGIQTKSPVGSYGRRAHVLVIEAKPEIMTEGSDPSMQAAKSYIRYWGHKDLKYIRNVSCCPSFLLAVAGPWMCILGAVYAEQVIVHPLTDFMWMGRQGHDEDRLCRLTRTFCALREGIQSLVKYYEALPKQTDEVLGRLFPYINRFPFRGQDILFDYFTVIAKSPARPVFLAGTRGEPEQTVLVKFVRKYNPDAHRMLAKRGLAPTLFYDSVDLLDCGFRMIVMEYMEVPDLLKYMRNKPESDRSTDIQAIRTDIESAVSLLHGEDVVFGDLREPNVLVIKKESGVGGMLIDFDWCSKHNEGRYPYSLNDTKDIWADGVKKGGSMRKEHDEYMLSILFEPE